MGHATSAVCPIDASHRTVVALEVVTVGILDLLHGGGGDGVLHSVCGDLRRRAVPALRPGARRRRRGGWTRHVEVRSRGADGEGREKGRGLAERGRERLGSAGAPGAPAGEPGPRPQIGRERLETGERANREGSGGSEEGDGGHGEGHRGPQQGEKASAVLPAAARSRARLVRPRHEEQNDRGPSE